MTVIDYPNITGAKAPVAPVLNTPLPKETLHTMEQMPSIIRECVNTGAAGARARRFLGHHLLILSLLVLCAPAVLRPRALQDAPAHVDPNS